MAIVDATLLRGLIAKWTYRSGWHGELKVTTHDICLPAGTPLHAPLAVAFASDFHAGPTTHPEVFLSVARELQEHRPDVLLMGGDFVSGKTANIAPLLNALSKYDPPLGKFAVLGNHDLWAGGEEIARQLSECGVEVLVNRNVPLAFPYDGVSICGIDDPWTGLADSAKAFENSKPVRIWLTHSPDGILALGDHKYTIGFAGHTHGGQICLPDGTPIVTAGGPLCRSHSRGLFDIRGNGPLIVSRGVGCSNLPVRINSDPELIICQLHSSAA
jgi:predicted MPP superfamily phosphohydrolase